MTTIATYDLLDMIRQKCDIIGDDKSKPMEPITKLNAFILFRAMWYCDEIHDFCGLRSGYNATEQEYFANVRFQQMKEDNEWYFNEILKVYNQAELQQYWRTPGAPERVPFNKETIFNIFLNNKTFSDEQKYILRLYCSTDINNELLLPEQNKQEIFFLRELHDLNNYDNSQIEEKYDIIPDLRTVDKKKLNKTKAKNAYITSNKLAHSITTIIRHFFFKIINIPFYDLLSCEYQYDFYKASILSNRLLSLVSGGYNEKTPNAVLYLNIDPTGTGATLSPLHYTLWKYSQSIDCDVITDNTKILEDLSENLKELNKTNDKLILSQVSNPTNVKLFITPANKWDASTDDELTAVAKGIIKVEDAESSHFENINFQITFGIPNATYMQYQYLYQGDNFALQITNFCGRYINLEPYEAGKGSVLEIANQIKTSGNFNYSVYKTSGDFLQFFTIALYERAKVEDKGELYSMLSQDLTGIDIGSLFCFNMIGCMHSGDKLKGLQMLLPKKIVDRIEDIKENDPEWFKILLDVSQSQEHITKTLIDPEFFNSGGNSFGKYNKNRKQSKQRKQSTRSKQSTRKTEQNKKTSKKLEKLKKEAKKMGLSKNVLKLTTKKLEEKINKLKNLAKKYRLKVTKKLISNIKKCIKIHENAKKLKIKLTKVTKSGKRLYKTPNELLKEIKKIKGIKKTKERKKKYKSR